MKTTRAYLLAGAVWAGLWLPNIAAAAPSTYAGITGGQSRTSVTNSGTTTDYTNTAAGLFLGWQPNNFLSLEAKYVDLGKMDLSLVSVAYTGASVSAIGSYPILENYSVFASVGAAYMLSSATAASGYTLSVSSSDSKTGLSYGVGMQYNVFSNIALRLAYDTYQCSALAGSLTGGVAMYSASLVYSFGAGSSGGSGSRGSSAAPSPARKK